MVRVLHRNSLDKVDSFVYFFSALILFESISKDWILSIILIR